ncbi:unnamed protein product, partial [Polarella glacialis]
MDRRGLRPMRALPKTREVSKQTLEQAAPARGAADAAGSGCRSSSWYKESQQPLQAAKPQPGLPQQTEDQEKDGLLFLLQIHAEKQEQQEKENPTLPSDRQQQPKQKKHAEKVQKEGQQLPQRFLFRFKCANEEVVSFQTTVKAAGGHLEKAARIARECYRKFESGASKSEVLILRNELYKDLPSEGNHAAAQPGCSSPKSEAPRAAETFEPTYQAPRAAETFEPTYQ